MIDWIDRLMSTELVPVVGAAEVFLLNFLLVFDCYVTLVSARKQAF